MVSATTAVFLISGILFIPSVWCSIGSVCLWSHSLRRFRSNSSCWHGTPVCSNGSRYMHTHPAVRSTLKVDVVKNSLRWGQLTSILVFPVLMGNMSWLGLSCQCYLGLAHTSLSQCHCISLRTLPCYQHLFLAARLLGLELHSAGPSLMLIDLLLLWGCLCLFGLADVLAGLVSLSSLTTGLCVSGYKFPPWALLEKFLLQALVAKCLFLSLIGKCLF